MMEGLVPVSARWKTIQGLIVRYPLISFTALAYAISWIAWSLMFWSGLGLLNGFSIIGAIGPALAAMVVSAFRRPEPSGASAKKHWQLFGVLSLGIVVLLYLRRLWLTAELTTITGRMGTHQVYPSFAVFLLDVLAATAGALVLAGSLSPRKGVYDLLRSLDLHRDRPGWFWFVVAVGIYPVIILLGNAISSVLGLPEPEPRASGPWYLLALDVGLVYFVTLVGGGGLEEPGWRGFALPMLERRYSPLRSGLILAVIWAFWHWPMFWYGFYGGGPLSVFAFVLGCIPVTILFTAIFHWTKSSLPIVILLHTSINITPTFLPVTMIASGIWWLMIMCVAIWMWRSRYSSQSISIAQSRTYTIV